MKQCKKKYFITVPALFALSMLITAGCNNPSEQEGKALLEPAPLVTSITISAQDTQPTHRFPGEVRGRYETALGFRVPGKVIARHVETGTRVKAGDLLMQVDPKDIKEAMTAAKAQVDAAESQYKLTADLLKRFNALYEQDYMSKAEIDRYQNNADSARAVLKQARAQLTQAGNQLDYCNLNADDNGVVLDVRAETGQVVAAGMPVVIMVKGDQREVEIFVPENQVATFSPGAYFHVNFWALPNLAVQGQVRYVSPVADPITRTYKTRITLIDPPDSVRLGMTASAVSAEHEAGSSRIFIPMSAVYQTGDAPMVWVIKDHRVGQQKIRVEKAGQGEEIQVIEGLSPGDEIVTTGVHKLSEGQLVRTQP
ncbi:efflux RND transporter periplasmic adaptor subunit [Desulfobacter hydrogenophilus]|uniref:Efflux RND transporter periplasmic adaptor subunit n=1 Tax=Desulfobacter hydrogenophilus TaxID=2291 RepID=A0A328FBI1_9BACT|nr:efflux RND transporter periplasmic adaptor subunit [Desulfobacter hydrogenophilus]NDY72886.1 efflux RND transporter periplasmic adaptor subunit [Desulfobacter hydrogenophilus]QBH11801.1 efflux RND transporter periplasmic adaptor subunit [Desulfobacter hydrogenophilus]RAM01030.1 efflux RND transporter periplasmic adaptor subunit [Desulfobacter hydrogenophilus]